MKTLYFATSNKWKFRQAERYFAERGIELKQFEADLPESRSEEGLDIAKEKARNVWKKLKKPVFVFDGSLCIETLNDFPKSYVKFFDKYIGAEGLLKLMKGKKNRKWRILNILYFKDGKKEKSFIGVIRGVVSEKLNHNKKGLVRDFDRVLIPEGYSKTYGEMTEKEVEEYDEKIWRPCVFDRFIEWFKR